MVQPLAIVHCGQNLGQLSVISFHGNSPICVQAITGKVCCYGFGFFQSILFLHTEANNNPVTPLLNKLLIVTTPSPGKTT